MRSDLLIRSARGRLLSLAKRMSVLLQRLSSRAAEALNPRYSLTSIDCACIGSIWIPGPMVLVTVTRLMNDPLAADGRAFLTASIRAARFS